MTLQIEVIRLKPGDDVRTALEQAFKSFEAHDIQAACVVSSVGSLSVAMLRYAAEPGGTFIDGPLELISLSGTLSKNGPHLHASVADATGKVLGGHVMPGCTVRTTAEIVLALLPQWRFTRENDAQTGFMELVAHRRV